MITEIRTHLKDALKYPFLDMEIVISIGSIILVISILNKLSFGEFANIIMLLISHILLFLEMGYGSDIANKGLLGEDKPPKIDNPLGLTLEGLEKYLIVAIFAAVMTIIFKYGTDCYHANNMPLTIICGALIIFIYVTLIGGLLNRYENGGKFIKAFHFKEIYRLLKEIGPVDILTIIICAIIAQSFAIQCFIDIHPNTFSLLEIGLTILTFFLAPIALISTKRFISLNLRRVYSRNQREIKKSK